MPRVMFPVTESELDEILAREGMGEVADQIRNSYFSAPAPGPVAPPNDFLRPLRCGATLAGFTYSVPHDRLGHWQAQVEHWAEKGLPCVVWGHHYVQYNSTYRDNDSECCLVIPQVDGVWEFRYERDFPQRQINTKSIWNALNRGVSAPDYLASMILLDWHWDKHFLPFDSLSLALDRDIQDLESIMQRDSSSLEDFECDQQIQFLVRANNILHLRKTDGGSMKLYRLAQTCLHAFPTLFYGISRTDINNLNFRQGESHALDLPVYTLSDYPLGDGDGMDYALHVCQEMLACDFLC